MESTHIIANWKMNLGHPQVQEFAAVWKDLCSSAPLDGVNVTIAPGFPQIPFLAGLAKACGIEVAAQTISAETPGAFTGQVSAEMLSGLATKVILGHSERRRDFGEGDEIVAQQLHRATEAGIQPVVCIGEPLETREKGEVVQYLDAQIRTIFRTHPKEHIMIAYEPLWAISTSSSGQQATPEDIHEVVGTITTTLDDVLSNDSWTLLYGGSVNETNAKSFVEISNIDGLLVGSASNTPEQFHALCHTLT